MTHKNGGLRDLGGCPSSDPLSNCTSVLKVESGSRKQYTLQVLSWFWTRVNQYRLIYERRVLGERFLSPSEAVYFQFVALRVNSDAVHKNSNLGEREKAWLARLRYLHNPVSPPING
ncbi:hypothetical protein JTE90_003699 [Oedothorax gibbosus]|uniref:Uncharacterized protein n=1 Tax=Oedothorax gibbosus TaxID=931172 RepID=A0AAV6VU37_9ARAC|nr:hypothetical protein JTE90_003699 [Oedothorax gibbosus]